MQSTSSSFLEGFDLFLSFPVWGLAIVVFFVSIFVSGLISRLFTRALRSRATRTINPEGIILVERFLSAGVVLLGLVIALAIVDIDITTLVGFLSLGIGFAFKDLLSNFIGGIVILTQHKFKIGDLVRIGEHLGHITEIEARTTQIRSLDGTDFIIPNAEMLTATIQNITANTFRRIDVQVGVHYSSDLPKVVEYTRQIVQAHPKVVDQPAVAVLATRFGDSAIDLEVRFWINSTDSFPVIRSEVIQAIKTAYDAKNITIPFPIRTLALDAYDQNLAHTCHYAPLVVPPSAAPAPATAPTPPSPTPAK